MERTKKLDYVESLEILASRLVIDNEAKIPVKTFAEIVGKSPSLIYKAASPNDDTPLNFLWLPAFMNMTEDFDILDKMNQLCGKLPSVDIPSFKIEKEEEKQITRRFIKSVHRVSEDFEEYLGLPSRVGLKNYKKLAEAAIKEILISINYAEKALKGNGELGL